MYTNHDWPRFVLVLTFAVLKLSHAQRNFGDKQITSAVSLFSGLRHTEFIPGEATDPEKIPKQPIRTHAFMSTSMNREVADEFRGDTGMTMQIELKGRKLDDPLLRRACNVSWISKFPGEMEVLVCPNTRLIIQKVITVSHGMQHVVCA